MHRSVRSLSRGLALIRELNVGGPSSVQHLSGRTGLNRTTCYRLLQTLQADGYVAVDTSSALFGLTPRVRMLGEGVSTRDISSQAALPPMFGLLDAISWPSDFAVFELGEMVIRESTHSFSPFSIHRSMVGRGRSLVRSALGHAILAAATPALRRQMLEIAATQVPEDAGLARDRRHIARVVARTRRDGYAWSVAGVEPGISAIALPVVGAAGVLGALNIVFFSSAMTPQVAASRYLGSLRRAVEEIEKRWRAGTQRAGDVAIAGPTRAGAEIRGRRRLTSPAVPARSG